MPLESHDPRRLLPSAMEERLIGWSIRAGGLALLASVGAAWASLLTWSQSDPSLTHAADGTATNALGSPGAIFADVVLNTLGFAGVFLLLAPMFWGLELMLAERVCTNRKKTSLFPLAVLLLAGGFAALPLSAGWPFGHSFGGIVGDWVSKLTATFLDLVGAERAMPLAGLAYFLGGFALLGYSVGLERDDLNRLIDRSRGLSRRRGALVPEWLGQYFAKAVVSFETAGRRPAASALRHRRRCIVRRRAASHSFRGQPRSSARTKSFKPHLRRPSLPARVRQPPPTMTTSPAAAPPTSMTAPTQRAAP